MTGPEHYREAENILKLLADGELNDMPQARADVIRIAQVHATLALAAATALVPLVEDITHSPLAEEWIGAAS